MSSLGNNCVQAGTGCAYVCEYGRLNVFCKRLYFCNVDKRQVKGEIKAEVFN